MLATSIYLKTPLPGRRAWRDCATNAVASPAEGVWRREQFFGTKIKLPPITFSYEMSTIDTVELADLFAQLATTAPSHAFHDASCQNTAQAAGASLRSLTQQRNSTDNHCIPASMALKYASPSPVELSARAREVAPARLRWALRRSTACVAAFVHEEHLPEHQHLTSRGLAHEQDLPSSSSSSWWPISQHGGRRRRRVLVGFARAVSDRALVATVHDLAVMREMQGRGLGEQLLDRLTRQLLRLGIADVGLLAPQSAVPFFERNNFGPDPEESITMVLTPAAGRERRLDDECGGWQFKPRPGLQELLLNES